MRAYIFLACVFPLAAQQAPAPATSQALPPATMSSPRPSTLVPPFRPFQLPPRTGIETQMEISLDQTLASGRRLGDSISSDQSFQLAGLQVGSHADLHRRIESANPFDCVAEAAFIKIGH